MPLTRWKFVKPCSPERNVTCLDSNMGHMWPQASGTIWVVKDYKVGEDYVL
jgi:hypothetical protein